LKVGSQIAVISRSRRTACQIQKGLVHYIAVSPDGCGTLHPATG
jgi:hypothetical protein